MNRIPYGSLLPCPRDNERPDGKREWMGSLGYAEGQEDCQKFVGPLIAMFIFPRPQAEETPDPRLETCHRCRIIAKHGPIRPTCAGIEARFGCPVLHPPK